MRQACTCKRGMLRLQGTCWEDHTFSIHRQRADMECETACACHVINRRTDTCRCRPAHHASTQWSDAGCWLLGWPPVS
jgi:hypothetical protein